MYTVPHFVDGHRYPEPHATSSKVLYNPATGKPIGEVLFASSATCDKAIASATQAFATWSITPAAKRKAIFFRFLKLLEKNKDHLAQLVTEEHGKTLSDAKASIARGMEVVEQYCNIVEKLQGSYTVNASHHIDCSTIYQPLGICAGIAPFNFPVMIPLWMAIPAIACGNTFLLKPSEQTPSAALYLCELLQEAGLPAGVIHCLQGGSETVDYLLRHPGIAAFTAVGSTKVAKYIYETAICHQKRAHTFGGAKNHGIVMEDADMQTTAEAIVGAAYGSAGERCMAISTVVMVGETVPAKLLSHLMPLIQAIKVGQGTLMDTDMGPIISQQHKENILKAIEKGVQEGATLLIDGRNFQHPSLSQGFFLGPSLFDGVETHMSLYQNEIFGPVLLLMRVRNLEEALLLLKRNPYGNGATIFTHNPFLAREFSLKAEVGMVGVNVPIPLPITTHPFGGWKASFFGDIAMHGEESIRFYTQKKTITTQWSAHFQGEKHSFHLPFTEE